MYPAGCNIRTPQIIQPMATQLSFRRTDDRKFLNALAREGHEYHSLLTFVYTTTTHIAVLLTQKHQSHVTEGSVFYQLQFSEFQIILICLNVYIRINSNLRCIHNIPIHILDSVVQQYGRLSQRDNWTNKNPAKPEPNTFTSDWQIWKLDRTNANPMLSVNIPGYIR